VEGPSEEVSSKVAASEETEVVAAALFIASMQYALLLIL
jgi:hypothetical protein